MTRTLATSHGWVAQGTALCATALADADLDAPSSLPGWTRKHVAAHLSNNAEALGNLVHWARTGQERRMYTSREQRNADIEAGSQRPAGELLQRFQQTAQTLAEAMSELTEGQWQAQVLSAQGSPIPATQVPWMRSVEVMIHAVDLDAGVTFADLPSDFLEELCAEDLANSETDPQVHGPLHQRAAYLTGRPYEDVLTPDGKPAPPPPPWL
ncbi:maleylpyruvate isomerase family mycothiol-dependent enzyme [Kribbella sp. NPDC050281]|uniref:maleylpyruvate isomerase family mycothiol-dependent enzyme n=1 Tax=Kribbella sp. NPDC050281 TaxID=3155515 RepID=UPI003400814E